MELLEKLPSKWFLCIERGNPSAKQPKGKPWFVYLSNGETIGTKHYRNVLVDGPTAEETLKMAIEALNVKERERISEAQANK